MRDRHELVDVLRGPRCRPTCSCAARKQEAGVRSGRRGSFGTCATKRTRRNAREPSCREHKVGRRVRDEVKSGHERAVDCATLERSQRCGARRCSSSRATDRLSRASSTARMCRRSARQVRQSESGRRTLREAEHRLAAPRAHGPRPVQARLRVVVVHGRDGRARVLDLRARRERNSSACQPRDKDLPPRARTGP